MNLPNFRQSPSLAAILRDLSTWSVADLNRAGRSKTVRNRYESIQINFTFNSSGNIWNCSLNLPFLHRHANISFNNSYTTTSVRIPLVDSTVRINLCHLNLDSNVKYESNNITTSSSRQYHVGILIFWSTRTVISDIYFVNVTADQPLSENSTAQWRGVRCGMGVGAGRLLSGYFWEHSNICNEVS